MEEHVVKILERQHVTHDVIRFTLEKPANYRYVPGQATEVAINKPGWKEAKRPFTFTSLNDWDHLEFIVKVYRQNDGVTWQLGKLRAGDALILHDVWGAINYQGEGTFIAGGAGVTPFVAILRQLQKEGALGRNKLIFSNKTEKDIILKDEFSSMLGDRFINTLTAEEVPGYDHRRIDAAYLKEKINDFSRYFYVCGPDPMVADLQETLTVLGADKGRVIIEQ